MVLHGIGWLRCDDPESAPPGRVPSQEWICPDVPGTRCALVRDVRADNAVGDDESAPASSYSARSAASAAR